MKASTSTFWGLIMILTLSTSPGAAEAQGRGNGPAQAGDGVTVSFSVSVRSAITDFYAAQTVRTAEALPPGIRRRLERGKPLPPGIARRTIPAGLESRIAVPSGFEVVEVGLDVLLVEVATGIVHDVLMDLVR